MVDDVNFPTLECTRWELIEHTVSIIMKYDVGLLSKKHLTKLITEIALGYRDISYHNFSHAFSLTQLFYICLNLDSSFRNLFSKEEINFCFLAGISHDMYHSNFDLTQMVLTITFKSKLILSSREQAKMMQCWRKCISDLSSSC